MILVIKKKKCLYNYKRQDHYMNHTNIDKFIIHLNRYLKFLKNGEIIGLNEITLVTFLIVMKILDSQAQNKGEF